jgi:hypothetical protein
MTTDRVEVFCDNGEHAPREWILDTVARDDRGWQPTKSAGRAGISLQLIHEIEGRAIEVGLGAHLLSGAKQPDASWRRFVFECDLCKQPRVARYEKAAAFFDTLAAAGVDRISLGALAVRV